MLFVLWQIPLKQVSICKTSNKLNEKTPKFDNLPPSCLYFRNHRIFILGRNYYIDFSCTDFSGWNEKIILSGIILFLFFLQEPQSSSLCRGWWWNIFTKIFSKLHTTKMPQKCNVHTCRLSTSWLQFFCSPSVTRCFRKYRTMYE